MHSKTFPTKHIEIQAIYWNLNHSDCIQTIQIGIQTILIAIHPIRIGIQTVNIIYLQNIWTNKS
jgi:hypothetical protein